jgi:thiol-disulfide isomerase/thioredoxin
MFSMALVTRRTLLAASATVLGGVAVRKPAGADETDTHVQMRPFSEITRAAPPRPLPAASFGMLDGSQKTLADFRGKPVVLNFWATWCVPCVAELPELDRLAATDSGLVVLAVSADRGGAPVVAPFLAAHRITHATILLDPGNDTVHALGVVGFPTTLLIDAAGHLRGTLEGPASWGAGAAAIAAIVG